MCACISSLCFKTGIQIFINMFILTPGYIGKPVFSHNSYTDMQGKVSSHVFKTRNQSSFNWKGFSQSLPERQHRFIQFSHIQRMIPTITKDKAILDWKAKTQIQYIIQLHYIYLNNNENKKTFHLLKNIKVLTKFKSLNY